MMGEETTSPPHAAAAAAAAAAGAPPANPINRNKRNYQSVPEEEINMAPAPFDIEVAPQIPANHSSNRQHLRLLPLAILVFYNVSGGPFGIEPTVRAGGNFYSILGFTLLPFVWSMPEALVTAELGSLFPEAAGGVAWVEVAFGQKAGLCAGYLGWISGATDNAIYPVLFLEYITSAVSSTSAINSFEKDLHGFHRFLFVSGTAIILSSINWRGLEIVGNASIVVSILAMAPFLVMVILGIPKIQIGRWLERPDLDETAAGLFDDDAELESGPLPLKGIGGIFWRGFLNNLFWNLNSYDSAASFAGEVQDVSKTFPRGILLGLLLTTTCYLFPLLIAIGATENDQSDWVDGHMATIAMQIAGPWLGAMVVFSSGISNLALFLAEMSADSWQIMGMSERGFLPKSLATRSRFGTPTYGIIIGTMVIVCMSVADFSKLIEMLNVNYALSLLMEYAAFVKLRYTRPDAYRPYRIPLPNWLATVFVFIPSVMIVLLLCLASWITYIFVAGVLSFGVVVYYFLEIARRRSWFEFVTKDYALTNLNDNDTIVVDVNSPGYGETGTASAANGILASCDDTMHPSCENIEMEDCDFVKNEIGVML